MALREFTDEGGRLWRVWDVLRDHLHPTTRAEDYLRDYLDGWIVFETVDGVSKRRLMEVPKGWEDGSRDDLLALLHKAQAARNDRTSNPKGLPPLAQAPISEQTASPSAPRRTFRFPGGRVWTVTEWSLTDSNRQGEPKRVLSFFSGSRFLRLDTWPADWERHTDDQLVQLMQRSFPREPRPNPTAHVRRANDRPRDL